MVMKLYPLYVRTIGQEIFPEPRSGVLRFQVSFGFKRTILLQPKTSSSRFGLSTKGKFVFLGGDISIGDFSVSLQLLEEKQHFGGEDCNIPKLACS